MEDPPDRRVQVARLSEVASGRGQVVAGCRQVADRSQTGHGQVADRSREVAATGSATDGW